MTAQKFTGKYQLILHPTSDDQKMENARMLLAFLYPEADGDADLVVVAPTANPRQLTLTTVGSSGLNVADEESQAPRVHWPTYLAPNLPSQADMEMLMEEKQRMIFISHYGNPEFFTPTSMRLGGPHGYDTQLALHIERISSDNFVPHSLDPQEIKLRRERMAEVLKRLSYFETLDLRAMQILGYRDRRIADLLLINRIDHRINFPCLFRINDLPIEILSNIFRYVLWGDPSHRRLNHHRAWIASTCRHWRSVALNDSTLWSIIWFTDHNAHYQRSLEWFERARRCPLDIRIDDVNSAHPHTFATLEPLLNRIMTKISTVRVLVVILKDLGPALLVLNKLSAVKGMGIPMILERLEIHCTETPYIQTNQGFEPSHHIPLLGGASVPSLNYVSINGVTIDWHHSQLSNLTTFDLRRIPLEIGPTLDQFRSILASSPRLEKLVLDGAGPSGARKQVDDNSMQLALKLPIKLLHLKSLMISNFSCGYGIYVISQIHAPNVREFTLMNLTDEDYSTLFAKLIERGIASSEVKVLTLWNVEITGGGPRSIPTMAALKLLASMPSVAYLKVAKMKRSFFDLMLFDSQTRLHVLQLSGPSKPEGVILPKLAVLECQGDIDMANLPLWLLWRKQLGAPLTTLYVTSQLLKTSPMADPLCSLLRTLIRLVVIPDGARTPEDAELLLSSS